MASNDKRLRVTELDFDAIKSNLKTYLKLSCFRKPEPDEICTRRIYRKRGTEAIQINGAPEGDNTGTVRRQ